MEFIPDSFNNIPLGTFEQTPDSPQVPVSPWTGVVISGPQRIILEENEHPVIPVCGYYLVPVLAAMDGSPLTVHVRRMDSDLVVSGEVVEEGDNEPLSPLPPGAPTPSRESFEGVSTGSYFNIDVQRYLEARLITGIYEVTVSFAGAESNPVQIEIVSQSDTVSVR